MAMSVAFVLMITDGQDTQKRAEDLQQAGYAIGPAWRVAQIVTGSKRRRRGGLRDGGTGRSQGTPGLPGSVTTGDDRAMMAGWTTK